MADLIFIGHFVNGGAAATGLTVTVNVDRIELSTGTRSAIATSASATEGRSGYYFYRVASASTTLYDYIAIFNTAGVADQTSVLGIIQPTTAQRIWDEVLTGATHNVQESAGRKLRQLTAYIIHNGTAQSGSTINTIVLDANASAIDGEYDPALVVILAGTGAGQCRNILQYSGTTKTAVVDRDWKTTPNNTSEFVILADAGREHVNEGLLTAASANTVTLNTSASSTNDAYNGQIIFIRSGTGADQAARIIDYVGSTKVATLSCTFATTPDATSAYVILPTGMLPDGCLRNAVWNATATDYSAAGSTGQLLNAAGGAADPLLNQVPGSYASGTAGSALARIGTAQVNVVAPASADGNITLIYGDDYLHADGRALTFSGTNWPTITGGTVALRVQSDNIVSITGTVVTSASCRVEITSAQVNSIGLGTWAYDLQITLSNAHVITLQQGIMTVRTDVR